MSSNNFEKLFLYTDLAIVLAILIIIDSLDKGSLESAVLAWIAVAIILLIPIYYLVIRRLLLKALCKKTDKMIENKEYESAFYLTKQKFDKNPTTFTKYAYLRMALICLKWDTFDYLYEMQKPQNTNKIELLKIKADFLRGKPVIAAQISYFSKNKQSGTLLKIEKIANKNYEGCLDIALVLNNDFEQYLSARCDKIAKQKLGQDFSHEDEIINNYEQQIQNN